MQLSELGFAIGITSGVFGMLAAHEVIHSRHAGERALGLAMLAAVGYMHFRISHVHFHHRLAATLADPATARRGESVYAFIARSIGGQWRQSWTYERRRAVRRRHPWLANRMHHYLLVTFAIAAALSLVVGGRALAFAAIHGAVAVFVLELFNYVAHYGLQRRRLPNGAVEVLGPQHSWNAPQRFTNWALFNSGHHSGHHDRPTAPHQNLTAWPNAPSLPAGYAATFCLALCPPVWRKIMDPRVTEASRRSP
ncbi:MAG TPA: alkane 1-monooxygenase [Stellaceae bacterium]|nr:alkane 1-monooxygenase [Stellaceae bacterium]